MIFLHQAGFKTARQAALLIKLSALNIAPCPSLLYSFGPNFYVDWVVNENPFYSAMGV